MEIIVDNGAYTLRNMGDVAMLQTCVERLRRLFSNPVIHVMAVNPGLLGRYCPGTHPLPVGSRDACYDPARVTGSASQERWLRLRKRFRKTPPTARDFQRALASSDAVVLAGGGFLNDLNPLQTRPVLRMLADAGRKGRRIALFSQGLGPLQNPEFVGLLNEVWRHGGKFGVRESRRGPEILKRAGVGSADWALTGDDAVEIAWAARKPVLGNDLGFSLRQVDYAALRESDFRAIAGALQSLRRSLPAELVPVPISFNDSENDPQVIAGVTGPEALAEACGLDMPSALVAQVARCRVMVTGTYHAGVFALAQGIPAVCLYRSVYYRDKMEGLAGQFPEGCELVNLGGENVPEEIVKASGRLWKAAESLRAPLLAAAERQVQAGVQFYSSALK